MTKPYFEYASYEPQWDKIQKLADAYAYNPKKSFKRLQRFCLWCLKRLGCQVEYTVEEVRYNRITSDNIIEYLDWQIYLFQKSGARHGLIVLDKIKCGT